MIRYLLLVALIPIIGLISCKKDKSSRPNIVLIYTDDQTYNTIGALGNEIIQTPNLDQLVSSGTTFTHAYNMGGWHGAICVASRSMMISGRTMWNAKEMEKRWREQDSVALANTWGKLMSNAGYDTYMTGKWHIQAPSKMVFDTVRNERPGMPGDRRQELYPAIQEWREESGDMKDWNDYMPVGYGRPLSENDQAWSPVDTFFGGFWEGGKHWSEVVVDDAQLFLEHAGRNENPFFMYLAFNAPHDPRQAPQEYLDMYPLEDIPLPENFLPMHPFKDSIGNNPGLRDEALAPFPRTEFAVRKHIQEYYAIISHLDTQVGRIINMLESAGESENTYVFFTSDHGLSVGQHGLLGKQSLYDHSIRVPLIVRGPGVPANQRLEQDVYLQDVMATSLEISGVEAPEYIEFNSFKNILENESNPGHYPAVYGAYVDHQRMIRKEGFKLLVFPRVDELHLFNIEEDPLELNNLAGDDAYTGMILKLFGELVVMQKELGDELDLSGITLPTTTN